MASAGPSNRKRHRHPGSADEDSHRKRAMTKQRECSCKSYNLYMLGVVGGGTKRSPTVTNDFQRYDFEAKKWSQARSFMDGPKRTRFAVATRDDAIWVLGGVVEKPGTSGGVQIRYEKSVSTYNRYLGHWKPRSAMKNTRADFCAVVLQGVLYAIGGEGTDRGAEHELITRNSVEVYAGGGTWHLIPRMLYSRSSFASCVGGGRIYVAGGAADGDYKGSIEYYSTARDQWTYVAARLPDAFPTSFGLAFVNEKLAVVNGGEISVISTDMTAADSPKSEISVASSQPPFYDAFALDGELYMVGRTAKNSMVLWKCRPPDNTWEELPPPLSPSDSNVMRIALIKIRACGNED